MTIFHIMKTEISIGYLIPSVEAASRWTLPHGYSLTFPNNPVYHADTISNDCGPRLRVLIEERIRSSRSLSTRRGYETFLRYFVSRHADGPRIADVDQDFIDFFVETLEKDFPKSSCQKHIFTVKLASIIRNARLAGRVTCCGALCFPRYHNRHSDRNLSESETAIVYDLFRSHMADDPLMSRTETMALAVFMIDIAFQGLAPVDLAALKISDLHVVKVYPDTRRVNRNEADRHSRASPVASEARIEAVIIETIRKKTGIPVRIVAALSPIMDAFMILFDGKRPDDYLLPCFDRDKTYTPEQRQSRLANYFRKLTVALNGALAGYYLAHSLGECRHVTYYFARHAFCNLADSLDLPRHIIQKMVGHRQSVLERNYLRQPTLWEQASVSQAIFDRLS